MVSLQQVSTYTVEPLLVMAANAQKRGVLWMGHWETANAHAQSLTMLGLTHDEHLASMQRDTGIAQGLAADSMTAAQWVEFEAGNLQATHSETMWWIDNATANGYYVNGDLKVSDITPPLTAQEQQSRKYWGEVLEERINTKANLLMEHDQALGAKIRGWQEDMATSKFSNGNHVSAVDYKTDKGQPPIVPDPAKQGEKKPRTFGDNADSLAKVAAGALGVVGGTVLVGAGAATEVGTDGVSSPVSIPTITGGLAGIAAGAGSIEKGLNELFGSGQ